jgi:hypothetical protein
MVGRRLETHLQGVNGGREAGNPHARSQWGPGGCKPTCKKSMGGRRLELTGKESMWGRGMETHLQGVYGRLEAGNPPARSQ